MGDEILDGHLPFFAHGFALNLALVASIGAQNVLIIRQGLLGEHLPAVVAICFVVDVLVITLGCVGFGALLGAVESFASAAAWAGLSFLLVYAMQRLRSALQPGSVARAGHLRPRHVSRVIGSALAVSLLNPQLYLDSFLVIGSLTAPLPLAERGAFAIGALCASAIWFAGFACAVAQFSERFLTSGFWRTVDLVAGCCMLALAAGIAWQHDLVPAANDLLEAAG